MVEVTELIDEVTVPQANVKRNHDEYPVIMPLEDVPAPSFSVPFPKTHRLPMEDIVAAILTKSSSLLLQFQGVATDALLINFLMAPVESRTTLKQYIVSNLQECWRGNIMSTISYNVKRLLSSMKHYFPSMIVIIIQTALQQLFQVGIARGIEYLIPFRPDNTKTIQHFSYHFLFTFTTNFSASVLASILTYPLLSATLFYALREVTFSAVPSLIFSANFMKLYGGYKPYLLWILGTSLIEAASTAGVITVFESPYVNNNALEGAGLFGICLLFSKLRLLYLPVKYASLMQRVNKPVYTPISHFFTLSTVPLWKWSDMLLCKTFKCL